MKHPRIAIIGAGPAGIAAAIQIKRLGYSPLLFEKDNVGGLLWNANLVENYPGFPDGIRGPDLINLMEKHLRDLHIEVIQSEIKQLYLEENYYHLINEIGNEVADYVVLASGTIPKPVKLIMSDPIRKLIHQDIRKLLEIKGKHIVIIGAGDAAFDHALNLSTNNTVLMINHSNEIRSLKLLADRVFMSKRITYLENTTAIKIELEENKVENSNHILRVVCKKKGESVFSIGCDEVVFAIGRIPHLQFAENFVESDKLYLVGDAKNGIYRQAGIAIGDGIMAAMKIHNHILLRD